MAIRYLSGINVDSNTLFVDDANNRVGIGTGSPASPLTVYHATNSAATFQTAGTGTGAGNGFYVGHTGNISYVWNYNNFPIVLATNNSERLRITAAGNVGIGTTAPSSILHVDGIDPYVRINNVNSANNQGIKISYNYSDTHGFHLTYNANAAGAYIDNTYPITSGQPWGDIYFRQNSAGTMVTRMTIKADGGNVGIGTTSPGARLSIQNSGTTDSIISEYRMTNGNNAATFRTDDNVIFGIHAQNNGDIYIKDTSDNVLFYGKNGGNVGIGTINPSIPRGSGFRPMLHVYNNSVGTNPSVVVSCEDNQMAGYIAGDNAGASDVGWGWNAYYQGSGNNFFNIRIGDNGTWTDRFTIDRYGNVGIGTTSPAKILTIAASSQTWAGAPQVAFYDTVSGQVDARNWTVGAISTNYGNFTIASSTAAGGDPTTPRLTINKDGNVGIGNTAPTQALHVSGNIRVTGAYYDSSNSAGSSGQVLSSTGSGTAWVNQGEATATSLYDLLPAARVAFNWTGQVVNDTWTTVFSKSSNLLTTGTWMVKMYVSDFATGGGHYTYTYSGMFTWYQDTTNQGGEQAASEIYLHRMGHAANASVLYLRTTETAAASSGDGLFQIKGNYSNTSNQTISFQFVKIF